MDRRKVLLVDDEPGILRLLGKLIRRIEGVSLDTAATLEEAMQCLESRRYWLVITDHRLTGATGQEGLDIIERLKESSPDTHAIMLTASGSEHVLSNAREMGAARCFEKPVPFEELLAAILELA